MNSPIRRKPRLQNWVVGTFLGVAILFGLWPSKPTADPSLIQSGDYQLLAINPDASVKLAVDVGDSEPGELDIRWLGIVIEQPESTSVWLRRELAQVDQITVRLDRRRLDENGRPQAYFFLEDRLLNAELVGRDFAREDTHPSDFAPISRQIRRAHSSE